MGASASASARCEPPLPRHRRVPSAPRLQAPALPVQRHVGGRAGAISTRSPLASSGATSASGFMPQPRPCRAACTKPCVLGTRCCGGFRRRRLSWRRKRACSWSFWLKLQRARASAGIVQPGGEVPAHEGRARHRQVAHAPERADAATLHRRRLGAHRRQHAALAQQFAGMVLVFHVRVEADLVPFAQRRQRRHEPGGQRVGIDGDGQRQRGLRLARRRRASPRSCRRARAPAPRAAAAAAHGAAATRQASVATQGLARRISTRPGALPAP